MAGQEPVDQGSPGWPEPASPEDGSLGWPGDLLSGDVLRPADASSPAP